MDLGRSREAGGRVRDAERKAGIAGDGQIKHFALVGLGRTERADDE